MDRFEQKEVKKKRPIKNTLYDWLINYIPEPIKKRWVVLKIDLFIFFKQTSGKQTMWGKGKKPNKLKIQKQSEKDNIIKIIRKLFELKKENEGIKDKIIRDINTLFEEEEEEEEEEEGDFYTPVRISNFWNKTLMESESNDDKNKNLSVEEYLDEIKPYLKDIIIDLQKSDAWKIHLTIAIDFISSKFIDEEHLYVFED